ncbi:MAG: hypothetical protein AB7L13_11255 [Acidimicrobiia bacterium]
MIVAEIVAVVLGAFVIVHTLASAIRSVVLPRAAPVALNDVIVSTLQKVLGAFAKGGDFARRDNVLAFLGPLTLLLLPVAWVALLIVGFSAVFWGCGVHPWHEAFVTSGSSVFTLGFVRPKGTAMEILSFLEAGLGLGLVALLISYLPTIYGAFARREAMVASLEVRAGIPPSPVELLTRYSRVHMLDRIDDELFLRWEQWFLEIEESHTSIPALVYFRSPQPERSWITAAGCVLDTAAIYDALVDHPPSGIGPMMMRTGFFTLRRIADGFGIVYDPAPKPTDRISVTRREFELMQVELQAADIPMRRDLDAAWEAFAGWRVNYDTVLVALAHHVVAPEGRWSSDRALPPGSIAPSRWKGLRRRRS